MSRLLMAYKQKGMKRLQVLSFKLQIVQKLNYPYNMQHHSLLTLVNLNLT